MSSGLTVITDEHIQPDVWNLVRNYILNILRDLA